MFVETVMSISAFAGCQPRFRFKLGRGRFCAGDATWKGFSVVQSLVEDEACAGTLEMFDREAGGRGAAHAAVR